MCEWKAGSDGRTFTCVGVRNVLRGQGVEMRWERMWAAEGSDSNNECGGREKEDE